MTILAPSWGDIEGNVQYYMTYNCSYCSPHILYYVIPLKLFLPSRPRNWSETEFLQLSCSEGGGGGGVVTPLVFSKFYWMVGNFCQLIVMVLHEPSQA